MSTNQENKTPTELKETRLLVSYGFELARQLGINKVLVMAELLTDRRLVDRHREEESIIWVTIDPESITQDMKQGDHCVGIPRNPVGRMDQISLALIISVMNGTVLEEESVVCLVGIAGSRRLDNLLIANPKRDFDWFGQNKIPKNSRLPVSQEFVRLVDIGLKFASEGREGKPIGTIFLVGDMEELKPFTCPLILNPCKGHSKKSRSIHDSRFVETMREFSALDGAFLIDRKGIVERAGVYLDAPLSKQVKVPKGLGARHVAAAAVTALSDSLAIVISESSGSVTVFYKGAEILSLSRPMRT